MEPDDTQADTQADGSLPCSEYALGLVSMLLVEQVTAALADASGTPYDDQSLNDVVQEVLVYIAQLEAHAPPHLKVSEITLADLRARIERQMHSLEAVLPALDLTA